MAVMTVNGPVPKEALGITLTHEHFFVDVRWACPRSTEAVQVALREEPISMRRLGLLRRNPNLMRDNLVLSDPDLAASEVMEFRKAGGGTIVDQSSVGTGRSPAAIRALANQAGIHVVMGCGFYLHGGQEPSVIDRPEAELADGVVKEIRDGAGDTGIRPGIIGEIGIRPEIGEWERTSLRVAARAHRETGLPVSVHIQAVPTIPGFRDDPNGLSVLDFLRKDGVPAEKIIVSHTDARIHLDYMKAIMDRGAYAEMDHVGKEFYIDSSDFVMATDRERVEAISALVEQGYARRLLISQDICFKTELVAYGGWGYAHILNHVVPMMLRRGIDRQTIRTIMVENPADVLDAGGAA